MKAKYVCKLNKENRQNSNEHSLVEEMGLILQILNCRSQQRCDGDFHHSWERWAMTTLSARSLLLKPAGSPVSHYAFGLHTAGPWLT